MRSVLKAQVEEWQDYNFVGHPRFLTCLFRGDETTGGGVDALGVTKLGILLQRAVSYGLKVSRFSGRVCCPKWCQVHLWNLLLDPVAPNWAVKASSRAVTETYSSNSSASGSESESDN